MYQNAPSEQRFCREPERDGSFAHIGGLYRPLGIAHGLAALALLVLAFPTRQS
jgi:hypothetical protein